MSHKATNWLASLDAKLIGHSEFRVLFHLCDCHNASGGCFPTQAYLMDQTGASNGTVNNALNALQHKGLIQRHRQFDGTSKRQKPTRYTLGFEMKGAGKGELSPKTGVGGAKPTPNIGDGAGSNLGGNPSSIQKTTLYRPGFEKKGTGKGEMSPKTEIRGAKPTPNIGDGADSNLEGDPSPIQRATRLQPTGEEPVNNQIINQRAAGEGAEISDIAAFWIEQIKAGKVVPVSAINPGLAREIRDSGMLTQEQLNAAGISGINPGGLRKGAKGK